MPRSSRGKSHKQSKHSSKEFKEYSDSEEDVKMKERNGKEEGSGRVSRDLGSGEKRKVASQSREGKDPSGHGNGEASEEYVASKRRKEKGDGSGGGSDRWNGGGEERGDGVAIDKELKGESSRIDLEKGAKLKDSKVLVDSKSKTNRRHDSGTEKKEENTSLVVEKDEIKGGSRVDTKRKSEKDSGRKEAHQHKDSKELKDKDRGSEKERKVQDVKRDTDGHTVDGEVTRKQGSQSVDFSEDRHGKRGRENTELPPQDELRNPEFEKELEKRARRRGDGSSDKDKNHDDARESDDRRLSSRGDRNKDERHKDGSYEDKYLEDGDRDNRHREDKYREDGERDNRHRDVKYWEDGERQSRHRDDKYREDGDRDNRHRDEKYHEASRRENRHREDKYREDGDRDNRRRDDKYREDGDRDDRYRDDKYREDGSRDNRHKEEKHREDIERDSRHRDGKQRGDADREKRVMDIKYRDEHTSRDRTSESDTKRLRNESNAADLHYRKSSNRDVSPIYDDRVARYKDDKSRRRANDKEDYSDIRSRTTKEQRSDAEKRSMSSAKVELVADRGRSNVRNADVEITLNHSQRRNSPSSNSHAARDHYRVSKQEELKYRDFGYEERVRHNVSSSREFSGAGLTEKISSSRPLEKSIQKVDIHMGELSAERRLRSDARSSPLPLVDKSPSSTSTDRRHLNRPDVRRGLDVEDSGQRSGGVKDAKDFSGKESKGSRELPMETHPTDELSQADGDNLSVSSPFTRTSHFSGNSRSLLPPPPPFRTGVDSHLVFNSSEDDNRGKSNNRHRRLGDNNMGRAQGNAWKSVPNWPSPVANGFMPFPHGPPPIGFHPVMQPFPAPPIFGVRPSMELNHNVPFHMPDADRFSSHGRPLGWRNPVDDSCPPPLHGWDANNAVFGDESHVYGRLDWDHNRNQMNSRGWETSGDMWKGHNRGVSVDLPSAPLKDDSARGPADEVWAGQSGQQAKNEQNQPDLQAGSVSVSQSSDALERNTPETPKATPVESPDISKMSGKDDARLCHIYLSKLDISADLTQPELYDQCTSMIDMDQNTKSNEDGSKILYLEEVVEAKVKIPDKTSSASLFAAINDSVFEKAMSLYKKQREEIGAINGERESFSHVESFKFVPTSDHEKAGSNDDKPGELVLDRAGQEAEGAVSDCNQEKAELSSSFPKPEVFPATACKKLDEPIITNSPEKTEELISTVNKVKMEVDSVSNQEAANVVVEDKSSSLENVQCSDAHLPGSVEDESRSSNPDGNHSAGNNQEQKLLNIKCDPLLFSDVSSEACEAVMPESIKSGSVNLSRIHHSPESTH